MARFVNRVSAAKQLLQKLKKFEGDSNTVVIGLPRGGIVTASEIAKGLGLPLGFLIVKKIGAPGDPELAIGAVTDNGGFYVDEQMVKGMNIPQKWIDDEVEKKRDEAKQRRDSYSEHYKNPSLDGKTVILVDDGVATGATMIAASRTASRHGARKVVIAAPAGPCDLFDKMIKESDEIVCMGEDLEVSAVGDYYDEFPEVTDSEVLKILENAENSINH